MTAKTNDALDKVAHELQVLLDALEAEPSLKIGYRSLGLKDACKNLRSALDQEPIPEKEINQ